MTNGLTFLGRMEARINLGKGFLFTLGIHLKHRSSIIFLQLQTLIPNNSDSKSRLCGPDSVSVYRSLDDFTASFMDSFILGMKVLITRDLNEEVLLGFSCSCLSQLVTRTTDTSMTNGCGAYNKSENVAMLAKVTPKKKKLAHRRGRGY